MKAFILSLIFCLFAAGYSASAHEGLPGSLENGSSSFLSDEEIFDMEAELALTCHGIITCVNSMIMGYYMQSWESYQTHLALAQSEECEAEDLYDAWWGSAYCHNIANIGGHYYAAAMWALYY